MKHLKTLKNIKTISATSCSCSYVKSMVNGEHLYLLNNVFLVSSFQMENGWIVLISVALTEFCVEFECFSQDLNEILLILQRIRLLSSLYLPALCINNGVA